jgi:hypothetical protein
MPREKLAAKFTGHPEDGFLNGVPARDLYEAEFDALPDDVKAAIKANAESEHAVYDLRNDAPAEAAKAERRIDKEAAAAAPPEAVSVTVAEVPAKAQASEKKA